MVDTETLMYVTIGGMALMGAGLIVATNLIDRRNPKIYLQNDEIESLSELEKELRKEKQFLEGFGSTQQSLKYQRVTTALENLAISDYKRQGWIRTSDLVDAERTHQMCELNIKSNQK